MVKEELSQLPVPAMTGTKWKLFKTSVGLFAEKGFANVSVRDIAAAMSLNPASIYNHFPSKNAIQAAAYNFYRYHYFIHLPPLDDLLSMVSKVPPEEIWKQIPPIYDSEIMDIMTKIVLMAINERGHDPAAAALVSEVFIKFPRKYLGTLINKMIEQNIIEPIDTDDFINIYSSFNIFISARLGSKDHSISTKAWQSGNRFLLNLLRPKSPQP